MGGDRSGRGAGPRRDAGHGRQRRPATFNTGITTDTQAWFAAGKIYNGLTFLDRDLNNHPDLAESWEVAPDGMTYTFRLRPGVRWHDG